jgi:hypothetical protein
MARIKIQTIYSYYVFAISFSLLSCKEQNPKQLLIGSWKLLRDTTDQAYAPPPGISGHGISYTFLNDSLVDTKRDYFKIIRTKERHREYRFIGTTTKYKIIGDSIKIYDLTDSIWGHGKKIKNIVKDTLFLITRDGQEQIFVRNDYKISSEPYLDQIALSTSGCYGSCPIINIIINSTGDIVFYGERYVDKLGFYEGHLSRETFSRIENEFRKCNIEKLNENYSVSHSDDETISTTFCRQNKFINSIEDYGKDGPEELIWAYSSLRYLFQSLELKKLDSVEIPIYLDLHYFRLENGNQVADLTQSESFLLWNYLRKGTKGQYTFSKKFDLSFVRNYIWASNDLNDPYKESNEGKVKSIESDGRYYTFDIEGQQSVTIDIGHNFFDLNDRLIKFREKNKYD